MNTKNKEKKRRAGPGTTAMVVALALAWALAIVSCSGGATFTANGRGISSEDFDREVERRISIIRKSKPEELEGEKRRRLTAETERQVATELIRDELMKEQAEKLGVEVTDADVDRRTEAERAGNGSDEFDEEIKAQGLSLEDYKKRLKAKLLVDALGEREKVCGDVTVTADEAESFYLTNKDLFSHTTMIHAAHILLDSEGQAKIVAERIKGGEEFGNLAMSLSDDDATSRNGGNLGWIEKGTMDPAFEKVAFSLESGQVSGVVEASDGYHIIKVLERREAYTPPYAEVRGEVTSTLESRKKEEKFTDWLRTVYANARIDIPPGLGKWDPILGMVVAS
ncbi:MAG: peptidylprolyl isomerase [Actinobacteria bacterium]|nr:peptidylprolyl isomerase [Actinomycetota bacterium]